LQIASSVDSRMWKGITEEQRKGTGCGCYAIAFWGALKEPQDRKKRPITNRIVKEAEELGLLHDSI
jgi:hypothetical protein